MRWQGLNNHSRVSVVYLFENRSIKDMNAHGTRIKAHRLSLWLCSLAFCSRNRSTALCNPMQCIELHIVLPCIISHLMQFRLIKFMNFQTQSSVSSIFHSSLCKHRTEILVLIELVQFKTSMDMQEYSVIYEFCKFWRLTQLLSSIKALSKLGPASDHCDFYRTWFWSSKQLSILQTSVHLRFGHATNFLLIKISVFIFLEKLRSWSINGSSEFQ